MVVKKNPGRNLYGIEMFFLGLRERKRKIRVECAKENFLYLSVLRKMSWTLDLSPLPLAFVLSFPFSRKRREGFPFIVWGSGGWTRVRVVCTGSSRARRGVVAVSSSARRRVVVNSVPWGLASGRVAFAHGGRAFRVAGVGLRMHVRAREGTGGWIRVAGVGKDGHRRCRERGFAWPAWGSVHAACVSRRRRGEWCDRWRCVIGIGGQGVVWALCHWDC